MSTGDFQCPYCFSYNCRDSIGRNCQDRLNRQWLVNPPVYQNPVYQYGPSILPIHPQPYVYQYFKTPESWQCGGCKRHYAPHIEHCECQVIGGTDAPFHTTWSNNNTSDSLDNPQ